ncbi:MAG: hypothetical protein LRY51_17575, partial [Geovibrio sp.]|nr:hypothetical protein [Geovibrio sp.]
VEEKYKQIIDLFVAYRETLSAINTKVDNFTLTKNLAYANKGVSLYGNRNLAGEPVRVISQDSLVEILRAKRAVPELWLSVPPRLTDTPKARHSPNFSNNPRRLPVFFL